MSSENFVGCLIFLIVTVMGLILSADGYKFNLGGRDGWVVNPSESFNHWAERNRFQVNDIIHFKYKKHSDSVLVVSKEDYFSCNTNNPIQSLTDGDSEFKFDHSGPFFFISGNQENCNKGQKLIVVVLAVRYKPYYPPSSSPSSSPPEIESPPPPVVSPPPSESPEAGGGFVPSGTASPTSAPTGPNKNWGLRAEMSLWLGVGLSVGVIVVLGSFSLI